MFAACEPLTSDLASVRSWKNHSTACKPNLASNNCEAHGRSCALASGVARGLHCHMIRCLPWRARARLLATIGNSGMVAPFAVRVRSRWRHPQRAAGPAGPGATEVSDASLGWVRSGVSSAWSHHHSQPWVATGHFGSSLERGRQVLRKPSWRLTEGSADGDDDGK